MAAVAASSNCTSANIFLLPWNQLIATPSFISSSLYLPQLTRYKSGKGVDVQQEC